MFWLLVLLLIALAVAGGIALSKFVFLLLLVAAAIALAGVLGRDAVMRARGPETGSQGVLPLSIGDPKAAAGRKILVVSTLERPSRLLRPHVGRYDIVKVVVPVVRQGILDWLANDERAFAHAQAVAERTASELPGEAVEAGAGEADLELAVRDALATFSADEVLVIVHAEVDQKIVESLAVGDALPQRTIDGAPVRVVVVREP